MDIKLSVYFTLHSEGREPRRGQEQGGGAGVPQKVGQSFAGPGEIKRREVELDLQESPGEIKSKAVELGCYRELGHPLLHLFLNSCFSDIVFVALLRTGLETAISEVRKLIASHWRGHHLLNIVVLVAAEGLADELFTSPPPSPTLFPRL